MGPLRVVVITQETSHVKQMLVTDRENWDIGNRPALRDTTGELVNDNHPTTYGFFTT
jgi:hypothetical protein